MRPLINFVVIVKVLHFVTLKVSVFMKTTKTPGPKMDERLSTLASVHWVPVFYETVFN
jgi:hypothetical protein